MGITHTGCGEEIRQTFQFRADTALPISHVQPGSDATWTDPTQYPPPSRTHAHLSQQAQRTPQCLEHCLMGSDELPR